ncbi:unnamed protein product [Prorocentrum cordatum]|uniref:Uncharacterized protein n=1 Tax=Prorocentrum cordatum TaxID=2364126 RepID=A0ABN9RBP2_9DINO|nr:unnamed protein product [Polarella glacialis]
MSTRRATSAASSPHVPADSAARRGTLFAARRAPEAAPAALPAWWAPRRRPERREADPRESVLLPCDDVQLFLAPLRFVGRLCPPLPASRPPPGVEARPCRGAQSRRGRGRLLPALALSDSLDSASVHPRNMLQRRF